MHRVGVAAGTVVVRPLGVQDEGTVGAGLEIELDRVVAEPRVEGRQTGAGRAVERAVHVEVVVAPAGPDCNALLEAAGRTRARAVRDRVRGEPDDVDLRRGVEDAHPAADIGRHCGRHGGVASQCAAHGVGDEDVLADVRGLVADHQQVLAVAGADVEHPEHLVEVALQEVGARAEVVGGQRGDVDPLVALVQVEVRPRRRALDVEHVIAAAEVDVQRLDVVVVDTVQPGGHDCATGGDADLRRGRPGERALEVERVDAADLRDEEIAGARERRVGVVRVDEQLEPGEHVVGRGVHREGAEGAAVDERVDRHARTRDDELLEVRAGERAAERDRVDVAVPPDRDAVGVDNAAQVVLEERDGLARVHREVVE